MTAQGNGNGNGGGPAIWKLDGNPVSSGDFLGTTNAMPLEIRTNGELRTIILPDGRVRVLNTSIFRDSLTVEGHGLFESTLTVDGQSYFGARAHFSALQFRDGSQTAGNVLTSDGSGNATWSTPASVSLWTKNGNDLSYNSGNVGLNMSNPQYLLDVNGDAAVRQDLLVGNYLEVGAELRSPKVRYDTIRSKTSGGAITYESGARLMDGGCVMNENFGVGTETPSERLTVQGNARVNGELSTDSLRVREKTELGYTEVDSLKIGQNSLLIGGQSIGSDQGSYTSLHLQPYPWSDHVYLAGFANDDGKVFVGTDQGTSGAGFDADFIVQGHTAMGDVEGDHGGNHLRMWCDDAHVNLASIGGGGPNTSGDLLINYYNGNDLIVGGPDDLNGSAAPSDLEVNGEFRVSTSGRVNLADAPSDYFTDAPDQVRFAVQGDGAFGDVENGEFIRIRHDGESANLRSTGSDLFINYYNDQDVIIGGPSAPSDLWVQGRVGIGVSPGSNTDPDGNPYFQEVAGPVHAQRVVVDLDFWSDHVLEKDYALPTLEDERRFVEKHGYLKGMPPEEAIREEGLVLGEMANLHQKEIEEIYLHLFQMKEKEDEQKKERAEMKRSMEALKEQNRVLRERIEELEQAMKK